jgi:hypothetical protein
MTMGKSADESQKEIRCKQFVRGISKRNITVEDLNIFTIEEIDAYVSMWMDKGFKLVGSPQYMGEIPDGAYMYLYTMTKDA